MLMEGSWHLMLHGLASFNDLRATGPRGGEKEFSTNWMMISAQRPLGGGHLLLRTMHVLVLRRRIGVGAARLLHQEVARVLRPRGQRDEREQQSCSNQ
jgi:hypothetical protein